MGEIIVVDIEIIDAEDFRKVPGVVPININDDNDVNDNDNDDQLNNSERNRKYICLAYFRVTLLKNICIEI